MNKPSKLKIELETASHIWELVTSLEQELWNLLEPVLLQSVLDEMHSQHLSHDDGESDNADTPEF